MFAHIRDLEPAVESTESALQKNAAEWNELLQQLSRQRDKAKAAIDAQHEAILRKVHQHAFKTNVAAGVERLTDLDAARGPTAELAAEVMARDARGALSTLELARGLPEKSFRVREWTRLPLLVQYVPPKEIWRFNSRAAPEHVGDELREDYCEVSLREPSRKPARNAPAPSSRNGQRQRADGPWGGPDYYASSPVGGYDPYGNYE